MTVRRHLYERLRSQTTARVDTDVEPPCAYPAGARTRQVVRVEYRGSGWTAVNIGDQVIPAGSEVRIDSVDGLTLNVRLQ